MTVPEGGWSLDVFATDNGAEPFTSFMDDLSDAAAVALDAALTHVLAVRGIDLANSEWLKPLGKGLHEFRVRHSADEIMHMFADERPGLAPDPESILLRVFVHFHGRRVVLLLSGYDKQDDASKKRQEKEIAFARKCLSAWNQQEARRRAKERKGRSGGRHQHR
jgi:putative component of toxin-antitoxin plasmid stabilization module